MKPGSCPVGAGFLYARRYLHLQADTMKLPSTEQEVGIESDTPQTKTAGSTKPSAEKIQMISVE